MSFSATYPITGVPTYASLSVFPLASSLGNGALAIALDTDLLYISSGSTWSVIGGGSVALTVGTIDSQTKSANGLVLTGNTLYMQSADGSFPGVLTTTTQTIAGAKTFTTSLTSPLIQGSTSITSPIFKSSTTNPSTTGTIRLANADSIGWSNSTNTGDLTLTLDSSNTFQFTGSINTTQSISATGSILASNFAGSCTGANTGDVTLGAVGSTPSANGASLSGQVLTLQPFDSTHPGVVTASSGGSSNFLRADGTWAVPTGTVGADAALDNLASVAINTSLLPGTSSSIDLGSTSKLWRNGFFTNNVQINTQINDQNAVKAIAVTNRTLSDTSAGSSVNWQSRVLGDTASVTAVDWANRSLKDTAAAGQLTWATTGVNLPNLTASLPLQLDSSKNITSTAIDLSTSQVTNTLTANKGGTGTATNTAHGVLLGNGASAINATAAGSSGQLLASGGASTDPGWTTPTYPTSSGSSGKILVSDGTNNVYSTPTFPNASATSGKIIQSDGTNWIATTPTFPSGSQTSGKILVSNGTNWTATNIQGDSTALKAPTIQTFTSTGTATGWLFTVSAWVGTIAVGDTYTNNSNTYTVQGAQTNGTGQTLFMSGTGTTSGTTLTKGTSASGPATITFSSKVATALYTAATSPSPLYLRVTMVGAGGGGGGGGSGSPTSGTAALNSFFGANILQANGGNLGVSGTAGSQGGAGGSATISSPASGTALTGGAGSGGTGDVASFSGAGGTGGNSCFGGGGGSLGNGAGTAGATNTGAGGGGGGATGTPATGGGGGAGGCIFALISSPNATYPYVIASGGTNGAAGTNGQAGAAGAAGYIEVTEHYQ